MHLQSCSPLNAKLVIAREHCIADVEGVNIDLHDIEGLCSLAENISANLVVIGLKRL